MPFSYEHLSKEQKIAAVQRLTALWAFSESGLGGVMHALQIPFTGLLVGGLAVIIITLIAHFSDQQYRQIFRSLLIVLIIKAMISPYTPFPAYIAVAFQAIMGFMIFYLLRVNFLSILLLSVLAMLESAIQKLLILTLFFGTSLWKATDELVSFIAKQFHLQGTNGSMWIISFYLSIYFFGAICLAFMAYKTTKAFAGNNKLPALNETSFLAAQNELTGKKKNTRSWLLIIILIIISVLLFVFAANTRQGWVAVLRTIAWTCTVMFAWYLLITPLFTRFISYLLKKKKGSYSKEIADTLAYLPALKQLAALAWQKSNAFKGWRRLSYFLTALIHWSLIYTGEPALKKTT